MARHGLLEPGWRALARRCHRRIPLIGVVLGVGTVGCRGPMSILDPAGPRAAQTLELWWPMLGLGLAVYVGVLVALGLGLLARPAAGADRRRPGGAARKTLPELGHQAPEPAAGERHHALEPAAGERHPGGRLQLTEAGRNRMVVAGGIVVPMLVLLVLIVADLRTLVAVAAPTTRPDLTLEVVAHQWWWEVRYPDQHISTANEIHIPSGASVLLHLSSVDVIHSFWIPRLAGKTDVLPGQTNTTWLQASEAGEYRGQCAEYCGIQHTNMALFVFADPPDQFDNWVKEQQEPAAAPADANLARGAQAFAGMGCITCHALRYGGSAAVGGGLGPDLTHLASRRTIAAGLLGNDAPTLERWISDPGSLKQGTTMPATRMDAETRRALAAYLTSLR